MSQKRLRVALLSFYPRDISRTPGGVRSAVYNLVSGLKRSDDLELHVVHCHSDISRDEVILDEGVTVHYLAMPQRRLIPNMIAGIGRIRRLLHAIQPDVVNAHLAHYAVAAIGAGYPTCYTIHGVAHREARIYTGNWFDRLRTALYAHYDAEAVRRATDLVAISRYVMDEYRERARGRWHRINNPVTDDFFTAAGLATEQPDRLLFAGSITEIKRIETLLEAISLIRREVPTICLHLAGRVTSENYHARLQAHIRDDELTTHVVFRGLLDREEMLRAYAEAAVVVLPSWQENAPMAISEAMAVGKPVVATRVGGVAELVADGETGYLVPVGNAAEMARRILHLLCDPGQRAEMGRRARESARERFSIAQVARRYHDLYQEMADTLHPTER